MTVALLIKPKGENEESRLVPISTEVAFRDFWQTGAAELGLTWVPTFETGIPIEPQDIPAIRSELDQLRSWMLEHLSSDVQEYVVTRIERLIEELSQLENSSGLEIFIG